MKESQAIIERVRRINSNYQRLEVAVEAPLNDIRPGETLMVRATETWNPYLRERWWPVGVDKNKLIIERPAASVYRPGQLVNVLGVVGQPYRFRRTLRHVLLIAYNSAPTPLLMMVDWLIANQVSVTLALLGEATRYETEHLQPELEIVQGDSDFNWSNRVTTVGWADQVFAVVSRDDELEHFRRIHELFSELRAELPKNYIFGVFRLSLPCAAGACHACMLRLHGKTALACLDGPALDLTQVLL